MRLPFSLLLVATLFSACVSHSGTTLASLRTAIDGPVQSPEESARNSELVEQILEDGTLMGASRGEVEAAIGRGDPCSRHPRCGEHDFHGDDWFYSVGALGEGFPGPVPLLLVGFDRSGRVDRVWNLRTH